MCQAKLSVNGTVAEARGGHSPEEWKLRLMQAKALGNTEVSAGIETVQKVRGWVGNRVDGREIGWGGGKSGGWVKSGVWVGDQVGGLKIAWVGGKSGGCVGKQFGVR